MDWVRFESTTSAHQELSYAVALFITYGKLAAAAIIADMTTDRFIMMWKKLSPGGYSYSPCCSDTLCHAKPKNHEPEYETNYGTWNHKIHVH
jgi:hypothetical protein